MEARILKNLISMRVVTVFSIPEIKIMLGDGSDYDEHGYVIDYGLSGGSGEAFNNHLNHGWCYHSEYDYNRIDGKL